MVGSQLFFYCMLCSLFLILSTFDAGSSITQYSITNFGDSMGMSTESSQTIAIGHDFGASDIQSNYWGHNLLPGFQFDLISLQSNGDVQTAMKHAIFESIQSICRDGVITSPIFLGIYRMCVLYILSAVKIFDFTNMIKLPYL